MTSVRLTKIIQYLVYLLALTPLIITPWTIFPFVFGRGLITQFLIEAVFALYFILAIFDKNYRPEKNILTSLFGAFIFILFAASLFGVDFLRSFWSTEERFSGWFYLLHIFLFFVIILAIFKTKKDRTDFLKFNVVIALAMFAVAILSLFGVKFWGVDLGTRISGTLGNPIFLAAYFILNLFFALYLFCAAKSGANKTVWLACGLIIFYGIALTQSRGALLGVAAGAGVAFLYYAVCSKQKKARAVILSSAAVMIFLVGAIFAFKNSSFVKNNDILNRISSISVSAGTAKTRLLSWQMALKAIKERPLLGWGVEGFYAAFNQYYNPELLRYSYYETWSDKPHNAFLEVGVDAGIPGILAYLALFASAVYLIYKKNKSGALSVAEASVLGGGFAAYFAQNLFAFDTGVSYLLFAVLLAFIGTPEKSGEEGDSGGKKIKSAAFLLLVAFFAAGGLINFSPLLANAKLQKVFPADDLTKKVDIPAYQKAMERWNPYQAEWRNDLAKRVVSSARAELGLYDKENAAYALSELKKSADSHPNNAFYHLLLGGLYSELGKKDSKYFDLAKSELDRALALSPERQHIYFALGRYYALKKDKSSLISTYEQVISLEPSAPLSYWEAAKQLYFLDAENPLVDEWLIRAAELGYNPENKEEFLFIFQKTSQYFLDNKNYKVLSEFYKQMEMIEPREAKWHAQRAMALYLLKDYNGAVVEIKKAIELDGSYKEEGEKFIEMIKTNK